MGMHRKNSQSGAPRNTDGEQNWFAANVNRQRRRAKLARKARKVNRRIARGK